MAKRIEGTGKGLARAAASGAVKAVAQHITTTYIIPLGVPAAAAVLGYLEGWPLMWVIVGAALTFGGLATGLVRFDDWRERRRVEHKLGFVRLRINVNVDQPGLHLGVDLESSAAVPIDFEIVEMRTRLANRVPAQIGGFAKTLFTVPPKGFAWFTDNLIEVRDAPRPGTLDGLIELQIRYGRHGEKLKHEMEIKKQLFARFDVNGALERGWWNDAA